MSSMFTISLCSDSTRSVGVSPEGSSMGVSLDGGGGGGTRGGDLTLLARGIGFTCKTSIEIV